MHQFLVLEIKEWTTLKEISTNLKNSQSYDLNPFFNSYGRKPGFIEELIQKLFEIFECTYEKNDPVAIALRRTERKNLQVMISKKVKFEGWV